MPNFTWLAKRLIDPYCHPPLSATATDELGPPVVNILTDQAGVTLTDQTGQTLTDNT